MRGAGQGHVKESRNLEIFRCRVDGRAQNRGEDDELALYIMLDVVVLCFLLLLIFFSLFKFFFSLT